MLLHENLIAPTCRRARLPRSVSARACTTLTVRELNMKIEGKIDKALIFDGHYFKNPNACGRYKSLGTWKRTQWLKDHPGDFIPLSDLETSSASDDKTAGGRSLTAPHPCPPVSDGTSRFPPPQADAFEAKAAEKLNRADAVIRDGESPSDSEENRPPDRESVETLPPIASLPTKTPPTQAPSLPESAGDVISRNGRLLINVDQFASILGVSRRTLYRRFEDDKGPSQVKITGPLYDRDEALKWAADRGFAIK